MYTIVQHPLVQHRMALLRDVETKPKLFRELVCEISRFLAFEALRDLPMRDVKVQTPVAVADGRKVSGNIVITPILRAGMGMLNGVLECVPYATVGVLGMQRNEETAEPIPYYAKLPQAHDDSYVIVVDPMLATGGSGCDAIATLKKAGFKKIVFLCIVSCPEGLAKMESRHPDVPVYTAVVDDRLNERHYIVPGLGDAGDRLFGTL